MRELRFDGLSQDGTRLKLVGKDGQQWSLVIDERVEAAIRRDRARISQLELQQAGALRPREIQARIRAGATAEDVAAASGLPIEHIRRFEGPVLTERAWVAIQAQATEVRRPGGDIELGSLVAERLAAAEVAADQIAWDAWRRDDGLWVVIATFPIESNTLIATWTYDATSRTMTVADDNARELSSLVVDSPLHLAPHRPSLIAVPGERADGDPADVIDLARGGRSSGRTPADSESGDDPAQDPDEIRVESGVTVADSGEGEAAAEADSDEADSDADSEEEPEAGQERDLPSGLAALFDSPAPTPARSGNHPPVPSFDDILFGPGKRS